MFKALTKGWKYLAAVLSGKVDDLADPKVQLTQAVEERQLQHRKLMQSAATVIGRGKQIEMEITRRTKEHEEALATVRQSVVLADEARAAGDLAKAAQFDAAGEQIAMQLETLENQLEELKADLVDAKRDAEEAHAAVSNNSVEIEKLNSQRSRLLSDLERAKMKETVNQTKREMNSISSDAVPSFDSIEKKIQARLAAAEGESELHSNSSQTRIEEVRAAVRASSSSARLDQIRASVRGTEVPAASGVDLAKTAESSAAPQADQA